MGDIKHRYVQTLCPNCLIRVSSFPDDEDERFGRIDLNFISADFTLDHLRWRTRLRNAWAVLRNRYDWSGFDLCAQEEAWAFRDALNRAVEDVFPTT